MRLKKVMFMHELYYLLFGAEKIVFDFSHTNLDGNAAKSKNFSKNFSNYSILPILYQANSFLATVIPQNKPTEL